MPKHRSGGARSSSMPSSEQSSTSRYGGNVGSHRRKFPIWARFGLGSYNSRPHPVPSFQPGLSRRNSRSTRERHPPIDERPVSILERDPSSTQRCSKNVVSERNKNREACVIGNKLYELRATCPGEEPRLIPCTSLDGYCIPLPPDREILPGTTLQGGHSWQAPNVFFDPDPFREPELEALGGQFSQLGLRGGDFRFTPNEDTSSDGMSRERPPRLGITQQTRSQQGTAQHSQPRTTGIDQSLFAMPVGAMYDPQTPDTATFTQGRSQIQGHGFPWYSSVSTHPSRRARNPPVYQTWEEELLDAVDPAATDDLARDYAAEESGNSSNGSQAAYRRPSTQSWGSTEAKNQSNRFTYPNTASHARPAHGCYLYRVPDPSVPNPSLATYYRGFP